MSRPKKTNIQQNQSAKNGDPVDALQPQQGEAAQAQAGQSAAGEGGAAEANASAESEAEEYRVTQEQAVQLKERFDALQKQCDDYLQTAQRVQAEFDNFRRRTATTRADALAEGARDAVKELLVAMDSLERAVDAAAAEKTPLAEGVALVQRQFTDAFAKLGVCRLNPVGEQFNPNFADAVMSEPKEGVEPGVVIEVFQKGYLQGEKVIRPSMVKVSS